MLLYLPGSSLCAIFKSNGHRPRQQIEVCSAFRRQLDQVAQQAVSDSTSRVAPQRLKLWPDVGFEQRCVLFPDYAAHAFEQLRGHLGPAVTLESRNQGVADLLALKRAIIGPLSDSSPRRRHPQAFMWPVTHSDLVMSE
jgi:hypothetical protein